MKLKFVALDFETANQKRDSVCAVGMAMVENGIIVDEYYSLVNPEDYFSSFNVDIHGITAADVKNMPNFPVVSRELWPRLTGNLVIAHNASFDIGVLKQVTQKYGLAMPNFYYACTYQIAKLSWANLPNHRLSTIAAHLELELDHHHAMSDARACAKILVQAMQKYNCETMKELARKTGCQVRRV
ncbi:MAG TPA: 3'-5' exonuclease [Patescibacteria group bacterium]|nr:3'-5' exonuclease [Patescibacteria group bacterium]